MHRLDWYLIIQRSRFRMHSNLCSPDVLMHCMSWHRTKPVVQIDEAEFGRRKYHRPEVIEGHWVLGMIQDGPEDSRLELCPGNSRSSKTFTSMIECHVAERTKVRTNGWWVYRELESRGYELRAVNHSTNFVDPYAN